MIQEELKEVQLTLIDSYIEHDCITGFISHLELKGN